MHWRLILRAFDASSMIYAWDNYPPDQFPPLWNWIAEEIEGREFTIPEVAFEEVERRAPDCADWLKDQGIFRVPVSNAIIQEALRIKNLLQIVGDQYHPKGVGENDLIIVATARIVGSTLISNEAFQSNFPTVRSKAKIPAVCGMNEVLVECLDFLTLIKESKQVFGARKS